MDELSRLVQMMQGSGIVEQLEQMMSGTPKPQNTPNSMGQSNFDPSILASMFSSSNTSPSPQNQDAMNIFRQALNSNGQNPSGFLSAFGNLSNLQSFSQAMENMKGPTASRQSQWRQQYEIAKERWQKDTQQVQQTTPENPFRKRQEALFSANAFGSIDGKDFPENWEDNLNKNNEQNYSQAPNNGGENFDNDKISFTTNPNDWNSNGQKQETPDINKNKEPSTPPKAPDNIKTSDETFANNSERQKPLDFDVTKLNSNQFDEFSNLFSNFLEKENVTPKDENKKPPPTEPNTNQNHNNTQQNQTQGTPFNNIDINSLLSMFQTMNNQSANFNTNSTAQQTKAQNPFGNMDMGNMMSMMGMFNQMNSGQDDKAQLLLALKPFLSPERIQKVDQALQFMQLFKILPMFGQMNF